MGDVVRQKYRNDFSRCNGDGCTRAKTCARYEAHGEAIVLKLERVVYSDSAFCIGMYYFNYVDRG